MARGDRARPREHSVIRNSFIALLGAAMLAAACTKETTQESAPEPVVQGDTITFPQSEKAPKLGTAQVVCKQTTSRCAGPSAGGFLAACCSGRWPPGQS